MSIFLLALLSLGPLSSVPTSLGPVVLEEDFSGTTTEDMTSTGTLCQRGHVGSQES